MKRIEKLAKDYAVGWAYSKGMEPHKAQAACRTAEGIYAEAYCQAIEDAARVAEKHEPKTLSLNKTVDAIRKLADREEG